MTCKLIQFLAAFLHQVLMKSNMENFYYLFGLALCMMSVTDGEILRLQCKRFANFSIIKQHMVLQGSVIGTLLFKSERECEFGCLMNDQCKSFNSQDHGDQRCELNSKSTESDQVPLVPKEGWTYKTTNYTYPLIGQVCQKLNPCPKWYVCRDTCECPGYQCTLCVDGYNCPRFYGNQSIQNETKSNEEKTDTEIGKEFKSDNSSARAYRDCTEAKKSGVKESGVLNLRFGDGTTYRAFCDMKWRNSDWTVLQRRVNASVNFDRPWKEYVNGFGNPEGNHWLGLKAMHELTKNRSGRVNFYLIHRDGTAGSATYINVKVLGEEHDYKLEFSGYREIKGNIGDSMKQARFSTRDRDNDKFLNGSCAAMFKGPWWNTNCFLANLNSLYPGTDASDSNLTSPKYMSWKTWKGHFGGIIFSEIKFKAYD